MKRLLQWLGFRPKETPQRESRFDIERLKTFAENPPADKHPPVQKRRASNNGVYFGNADAVAPTWGDADPMSLDYLDRTIVDDACSFQGFGGGDTDGAGAGGSWDDGGSSSDSSSGE